MRLQIFFFIFTNCVISLINRAESLDPRIVGGSATNITTFPYQISLRSNGRHICGGSIIDHRHVLTAAHCVTDDKLKVLPVRYFQVVAGNTYLSNVNRNQIKAVQYIFKHPTYYSNEKDDRITDDIAVIRIVGSFGNWTSGVKPIFLAKRSPQTGLPCNVSGWGVLYFESKPASDVLRYVEVPIVSYGVCKSRYASLNSDQICAGASGKDACQGDSGGPLVCDGALAGVVSYGFRCAYPGYPGVYTAVHPYTSWIEHQIQRSSSTQSQVTVILVFLFNTAMNL